MNDAKHPERARRRLRAEQRVPDDARRPHDDERQAERAQLRFRIALAARVRREIDLAPARRRIVLANRAACPQPACERRADVHETLQPPAAREAARKAQRRADVRLVDDARVGERSHARAVNHVRRERDVRRVRVGERAAKLARDHVRLAQPLGPVRREPAPERRRAQPRERMRAIARAHDADDAIEQPGVHERHEHRAADEACCPGEHDPVDVRGRGGRARGRHEARLPGERKRGFPDQHDGHLLLQNQKR